MIVNMEKERLKIQICNNIDEVIANLVTLDKSSYVYVIKGIGFYYVQNEEPLLWHYEKLVCKGRPVAILKKLTNENNQCKNHSNAERLV